MIKVDCPSCSSGYDVDERRLPSKGLNMRCPKCDARFVVQPDGTVGEASAPAPSAPPSAPPAMFSKPKSVAPSSVADTASDGPVDLFAGDSALGDSPLDDVADLPAPKVPSVAAEFGSPEPDEVDLPAPKSSALPEEVDLPAPLGVAPDVDEVDLPAPKGVDAGVDLPAPVLEGGDSGVDLPRPVEDEVDLPMAMTDAELPKPAGAQVDLPTPKGFSDLPAARDDFAQGSAGGGAMKGDSEVPLPDLDLPIPDLDPSDDVPVPDLGVFGDAPDDAPASNFELDATGDSAGGLELELDLGDEPGGPPPVPPAAPASPGEGSLEFEELDAPAQEDADDGLEFNLPEDGGAAIPGALPARRRARPQKKVKPPRPPWVKSVAIGGVILIAILGTGFGLTKTKHGLFGIHAIEQWLPSYGDADMIAQTIAKAEATASVDTYAGVTAGSSALRRQLTQNGVNRTLLARALLHESLFQVRFGDDAASSRRANEIRRKLEVRGDDAPGIQLALAAYALQRSELPAAKSALVEARRESPGDPYVQLVAGELALRSKKYEKAAANFGEGLNNKAGARAQWGIARALTEVGAADKALEALEATLTASPDHLAARNAKADKLIRTDKLDEAYALLDPFVNTKEGNSVATSKGELATAIALTALVEEHRGRRGRAREAYARAAELDPKNVKATLGAGRLLLGEGGYKDALTKFRAVINAGVKGEADATGKPADLVQAKLGAADALLAMGRPKQASEITSDLRTAEAVSPEVELAFGRIAEALKDGGGAVKHYRNAIRLDPKAFRPYMALSQYYSATGRHEEAVAVLVEAEKQVDTTPEVRRLRGEAELSRNRVDDAIREFKAAVAVEPSDSASNFGLAVAYRKKGELEKATEILDVVTKLDKSYPGLALERGRLAEAKGSIDEAVASYRSALEESPKDLSLKSRLGAALVLAGQLQEAEKLLNEVLEEQPFSAEAEHYLGRVSLARNQLSRARDRFTKAVRLDPQNGLYRMYVGWAALESNDLSEAMREFKAALERDPRLGDAYWLRARLRVRMGAVQDALNDLKKALKLNPERIDAYATMADCYDQLGRDREAIRGYQEALSYDDKRPFWWARLGRLYSDVGETEKSVAALRKAVSLGDATSGSPSWLADAHRLLGDHAFERRERKTAIVHYGRYLELAPRAAIDRATVEQRLRDLGVKFHEEP